MHPLKIGAVLAFLGSSTAWNIAPRATIQSSVTTASLPSPTAHISIPSLTTGQTLTTSSFSTTSGVRIHALGGPDPFSTATETETETGTLTWLDLSNPTGVVPPPVSLRFRPSPIHLSLAARQSPTDPKPRGESKERDENKENTVAKRSLPSSVDWRSYAGWPWLATIQNQDPCGSCWVFAATALVEAQTRIEHGIWAKRSEADLHDQMGVSCQQGGGPDFALNWAFSNGDGIADPQCDEYTNTDKPWLVCGDRSGRAVRIPEYVSLNDVNDQKEWLANVGPIAACFIVYWDFWNWNFTAPTAYKWDGTSKVDGSHCILIVGYDDNIGGWLFRNSWGLPWGINGDGYGYIGYGQANVDVWTKFGIQNVNPDPWTKRRHRNGNMFESGNGATHRNFELFRSNGTNGFTQVFRNGEAPYAWAEASNPWLSDGKAIYGQPVAMGSSFNRDFELVYVGMDGTLNHWYYSQARPGWFSTGTVGLVDWLAGFPGFVEMGDSSFSVVVKTSEASLHEYIRDSSTGYWSFAAEISPSATISQSGPSLVQSNVGLDIYDANSRGNLYVVAVTYSQQMQLFWRAGYAGSSWIAAETFGSGITPSPPVMIQDFWRTEDETTPGGFQLLVAVNGQVQHWQRVNTDILTSPPKAGGAGPWQQVHTFGTNIRHVWSLLQGSFNWGLEAIVEDTSGNLWHWSYTLEGWNQVAKVPGLPGGQ